MIVSGLSHNKVVDILRKAEGTVQLTICRDILPLTYSESPTPPNMSAQTEAVLAEQPAPVSSPDTCASPEDLLNKAVERPPGMNFTTVSPIMMLQIKSCRIKIQPWFRLHFIIV